MTVTKRKYRKEWLSALQRKNYKNGKEEEFFSYKFRLCRQKKNKIHYLFPSVVFMHCLGYEIYRDKKCDKQWFKYF